MWRNHRVLEKQEKEWSLAEENPPPYVLSLCSWGQRGRTSPLLTRTHPAAKSTCCSPPWL